MLIVVSGTKRSGTSMWMQVLQAAGLPILGEAFPAGWERTIKDANPDGFYESLLREGIYYRTNPHPVSGQYFLPEQVAGYAVKIFVPGVVRTERAYLGHVVANVRPWREYAASIRRLYELEASRGAPRAEYVFPPAYEWWMENFALVRDISLRRYPARLFGYAQVLAEPERVVSEVVQWIGRGDAEAAVRAVKPERRTQQASEDDGEVPPEHAKVFDALVAAVEAGSLFTDRPLLAELNTLNRALLPQLAEMQARAMQALAKLPPAPRPKKISGMPELG